MPERDPGAAGKRPDPALRRRRFEPWPFAGWALVGALWALSLASAFALGIFLLPVALAGTVYLCLGYTRPNGWPGALAGIGVIGFYLAYLHRHGPSVSCTGPVPDPTSDTRTGASAAGPGAAARTCTELLNPWMFLGAGIALVVACGLVSWYWYTHRVVPRYRR